MAEKRFHTGGVVQVAPRPLVRAIDGAAIDRMNEGALTMQVGVDLGASEWSAEMILDAEGNVVSSRMIPVPPRQAR